MYSFLCLFQWKPFSDLLWGFMIIKHIFTLVSAHHCFAISLFIYLSHCWCSPVNMSSNIPDHPSSGCHVAHSCVRKSNTVTNYSQKWPLVTSFSKKKCLLIKKLLLMSRFDSLGWPDDLYAVRATAEVQVKICLQAISCLSSPLELSPSIHFLLCTK